MKWQPIETAPDPEMKVLCLFENGEMAVGLYLFHPETEAADEPDEDGYMFWGEASQQDFLLIYPEVSAGAKYENFNGGNITHWMPLPKPPDP
jgi:hypothetical protein